MDNWQKDRIVAAINGTNPMVMVELEGGYATFGDTQFLPGYCVLLPKKNVASLNELNIVERTMFLRDMSILGDAVLDVCHADRINYDILGNTDKFLHAHVFPRYKFEDPVKRTKPVWLYNTKYWTEKKYQYNSQKHGELKAAITRYLIAKIGDNTDSN
ncbi:hypothetical protein F5ESL0236_02710 [Lactobacillus sp. ESL0236]|uniref:HIT family protein n=1 Tax=unclassified Lactobacillus TaxID=2620435 RepID=UPI000EFC6BB9|nr:MULTISPECIES: hypothetical protein [unclassified Lactobacillus]RMC40839.1 hypothetical protein F5ESL0237_02710 [Lactobacillus sp. ESL0237]RMC44594.1 hypothetical protein F5ESL0234_02705 [Lactobacillus sp. ESL0234]RMC45901.1 hypothetical protein F5ESL0236_02710 [Lactobacillus sp. ESL0236]